MPNRYVRASAIESESVCALSWMAEVFWRRLLNRADDFGRFTANSSLLRASLFPLQLEKVSLKDIDRLLAEVEAVGLLFRYTSKDGKPLLVMNKWENGRAKHSEYEPPPADVCERMKTYVYTRKHMSAHAPDSDTDTDTDTDTDNKAAKPPEDVIYSAYPRKVGPAAAKKAIRNALKSTPKDELLQKTIAYATATDQWPARDRQFIPHPATWFNQGRFNDDPNEWTRSSRPNPSGRSNDRSTIHTAAYSEQLRAAGF